MNTKHPVRVLLFILSFQFISAFVPSKKLYEESSWELIENSLFDGRIDGLLDYYQVIQHLEEMKKEFPEYIFSLQKIGKSFEERDIIAIGLSAKKNIDIETMKDSSILFTGFMHGNEITSTSMIVYLINYLIHSYIHNDPKIKFLMENREIWFIPMINPDAYRFISDYYITHNHTTVIRKNRRDKDIEFCGEYAMGVDLNRNFDINFGRKDIIHLFESVDYFQSKSYVCKPFYAGSAAFSEPETQSIRDFLDRANFKMGINFMENGNMFLIPYAFDDSHDNTFLEERDFYSTILQESPFPAGIKIGTRYAITGETNHGEISDYMLKKKKIIAATYNLGVGEPGYDDYFPEKKNAIHIIKANLQAAIYFISKAGDYITITENYQDRCNSTYSECSEVPTSIPSYLYRANVKNTGLQDYNKPALLDTWMLNPKVYRILKIFVSSANGNIELDKSAEFQLNNVTHYHISLPSLKVGELYKISLIIVKLKKSLLGEYEGVPPNKPQYVNMTIENYPSRSLLGVLSDPNFNVPRLSRDTSFNMEKYRIPLFILVMVGVLLGWCCWRRISIETRRSFEQLPSKDDSTIQTSRADEEINLAETQDTSRVVEKPPHMAIELATIETHDPDEFSRDPTPKKKKKISATEKAEKKSKKKNKPDKFE